jgi:hypothetical protein
MDGSHDCLGDDPDTSSGYIWAPLPAEEETAGNLIHSIRCLRITVKTKTWF